ncbi:MFS transporter [Chryseosolibacter indicus]|uniref:MFS transporter n=1 Tax=Chryseosolibacter indicus TaxID=2782351 RepID=A0ABS5W039_9BACT|nr:MFS transporter [Chryseosolibacter indicus]MBT1705646.1 MFS transporter [Chryseosolibacter indicus]
MKNQKWFRTYIFIWTGQFISTLTSYAVQFAVVIWLSLEYDSAEVLAFAGIAGLLPQALIGPFVGVFIDRWDRKKVMIYADAFIAFCAFAMTFVLKEGGDLLLVYVLLGCRSIGNAFHTPAMQAVAPLIVPESELLRVSGINQMLQSVSSIGGPALGTLAITFFSISNVLYLDVFGAVAAIGSLLFVTIPRLDATAHSSMSTVLTELKDGFSAIYSNKGLGFLFLYAMIATFFIMPVAVLFPLLTTGHYAGGKWQMSLIEIVWGIGMLAGGSLLGMARVKISKVILVNTMHIILGFTFVLSGWFPPSWFPGFVLVTTLGGMSMSIFSAAFMTTIQEEVEPHMLGRVFSLYFSMALLPSMVGLLFTGVIAEIIGVTNAFLISGTAVLLVGIVSFLTPALMRLGKKDEKQGNFQPQNS